ncbi:glycosyltransferase family 2 protein [Seonamhaeicola maritimus]|uniref:Glycosyltransferase n=1 Tax=Seonamhaeicola maritimus TaxID=2591822 RepID=A0A5C7GGT9_9FLAO|nr:glycosyltransferase [Seonamhaeicola maritimus]TXG36732.1 glycosyltransferase [Seonamhaeicola maritimus]
MALLSIVIILTYLLLIGSFVLGFDKVKNFELKDLPPKTTFSIIIPFRNEVENIPELLNSISKLEYPKNLYEIIFVDDHSEDDSVEVIKGFDCAQPDIEIIKNERHSNSPKKDAISTAVNHSKNEWIITTDADCVLPKYWLVSLDEFIQKKHSKCIVPPVTYNNTKGFLNKFQLLDFLSMQGATIGGFGINKPFMCNGANFAYRKTIFNELNGFEGNRTIASGDDIFFLEKVIKVYPKGVHYLKSEHVIVNTKPQLSWSLLINQRLRWASKASTYNNWFSKFTGVIVLLSNALIITLGLFSALSLFNFRTFLYLLFIKFNIDLLLIYKSASFFNQREVLQSFPFAFIIYPFFSVYITFLSLIKKYKWKGRTFKK